LRTTLPKTRGEGLQRRGWFQFAENYSAYCPQEESFFSHNERDFLRLQLNDIKADTIASLPAVVDAPDAAKIAIGESDVED